MRAVLIGLVTAIVVTLFLAFGVGETLELPARDRALRFLPRRPAEHVVVVAIDERSLREFGPWPWNRALLAQLVDRAADAGARAVMFDILLSDPRPGDDVLARSMHRLPVAAVSVLIEGGEWIVPTAELRNAATVAHGNFELDHDGIHRRFSSTKQNDERAYTALSLVAASHVRPMAVPVGQTITPMFRTAPRAIPIVSAADLLAPATGNRQPEPVLRPPAPVLRNKILFIGPTALGLGDRVLTPVSSTTAPDPGVTVHAASTEALLRGEELREMAPVVAGLLAGIAVGIVLLVRRRGRRVRLAVAAAIAIAILGGGIALLADGLAIPFVILLVATLGAAALVEATAMARALRTGRVAASRLESGLGIAPPPETEDDLGPRLEEIATRVAERRAQEIESKRLLAHELKTPLASMRGLTQLLGGFELTGDERRRVASLLEAEAGKLQSMVTALLDLERLPLRDFATSSAVTDLGELVANRIDFLRASAGRPLVAEVDKGVPVRGDAMLLERVIDNLVGNALKYTESLVRIRVHKTAHEAVLEVEDRGPGVPEGERVFQRFFRGRTAAGTEGLGLGLALVAEVARWHRGRVALEPAREGGSVFRFMIPLGET